MKFTAIICLFGAALVHAVQCDLNKICGSPACDCEGAGAGAGDCDATTKVCAALDSPVVRLTENDLQNRQTGTNDLHCVQGGTRTKGKYATKCSNAETCNQFALDDSSAVTLKTAAGLCVTTTTVLAHAEMGGNTKNVCIGASATATCSATQKCNFAGTDSTANDAATSVCINDSNVHKDGAVTDGTKVCFGTNAAFVCDADKLCTAAGADQASTCAELRDCGDNALTTAGCTCGATKGCAANKVCDKTSDKCNEDAVNCPSSGATTAGCKCGTFVGCEADKTCDTENNTCTANAPSAAFMPTAIIACIITSLFA